MERLDGADVNIYDLRIKMETGDEQGTFQETWTTDGLYFVSPRERP